MSHRVFAWAVALALTGGSAFAQTVVYYFPHTGVVEIADAKDFTDFATPSDTHTTGGITFNLFYEDIRTSSGVGFDGPNGAAAQQRVKDTLDEVAASLNESGTLDVFFDASETDGNGFLASAGSAYAAVDGFTDPASLRRITSGSKPFAGFAEMSVTVDFGFTYNFTSAATPSGQTDFFSLMLHEFTHALGFGTLTLSDGTSQFQSLVGSDTFTTYDSLLVRGQGGSNLWDTNGNFVGDISDLTSQDLFFEGTTATSQFDQGGAQAGIFAPSTFTPGSSISHWDTGNIPGGAVMEHIIISGTDRREYAPVDIGALIDIGWGNAGPSSPDPTVLSVSGGGFHEEGQDAVLTVNFADETGLTFQWQKETSPGSGTFAAFPGSPDPRVSGETTSSLTITTLIIGDSGAYRLQIDDGTKAITFSPTITLDVVPAGSLPVFGAIGLVVLGGALTIGGVTAIRRRRLTN